jgi:hypothetical protein
VRNSPYASVDKGRIRKVFRNLLSPIVKETACLNFTSNVSPVTPYGFRREVSIIPSTRPGCNSDTYEPESKTMHPLIPSLSAVTTGVFPSMLIIVNGVSAA